MLQIIPNTNVYNYILTLSKPDIAGILTACGYAIRESITLIDALEELGFAGIDLSLIEDIASDNDLTLLSLFCVSQLSILNNLKRSA